MPAALPGTSSARTPFATASHPAFPRTHESEGSAT
jgi:hypothetical protein